jgi:hypothetical protein
VKPLPRIAPRAALLLTACATVTTGCAAATQSHAGQAASSHAATPPTPRARAIVEAAAILKAFVAPPGARRLPQAPHALKIPITSLGSIAQVDDVSFWRAPGQPKAVLAWEQAHLRGRFTLGDADFGPPSWDRMFSLPPIPGVLNVREMVVEVTSAGRGLTAIRVDAQVSWQPPRPAAEQVPSAARVVTITQLPSLNPRDPRPPAPVTITNRAVVRRLAVLVDSLQLSTIGPGASCPAPPGGGLRLTFRGTVGGPALAVAQGPAACGTVQFSAAGKQDSALQLTDTFIPHVLKLAGLHWNVP